ncbi:agmatinase [Hyphococcus lacteus]|uniref:Agmatinase n=1 Tax=Hyphococcus lacteus TaxID=3143536 RepID=A0ABV3Z741_9PROT
MSVQLIGLPWDSSSSYARGPSHGPAIIRTLLFSDASSPYSLSGINANDAITGFDFADLPKSGAEARAAISDRIRAVTTAGKKPLSLGGDHSVTFPILKTLSETHGPLNILHIDAHTDLYDTFEGDPYSHACPFARAIEHNCIDTLVQVGLRSISPDAKAFGEDHGVVMLESDAIDEIPYHRLTGPLYVSIDLDGIDPAFAPGVSHPEPGGLSSREVIGILKKLPTAPIGADVVELNPERDQGMITAHLAARLVKELAGYMA